MGQEIKRSYSPLYVFYLRFKEQKLSVVALWVTLLIFVMAFIGPYLTPYDPLGVNYEVARVGPSAQHWAGTDAYGRDLLTRLIYGAKVSMTIGLVSVSIGAVVGVILGVLCGLLGGLLDAIVMRTADVLFAFPSFLLAIAIVAVLGPGVINIIIAISIFSTPTFARITRSVALGLRHSLYVKAAKTMGGGWPRIIFVHIIPNTIPYALVYFTMRIGTAILTASSLSFLGLGAQPPSPEWGAMLAEGREYMLVDPYLTIFPGIFIFVTVLSFNVLGDGLSAALHHKR